MTGRDRVRAILVVEGVEEMRDGMARLLVRDGYQVYTARTPAAAIERARLDAPDLILARLDGAAADVINTATDVRTQAGLGTHVPVVAFCSQCVAEGAEKVVGENVHATWPDNFDQLRRLLARLLAERPAGA
jgi:CheY-like chemotaxis protein